MFNDTTKNISISNNNTNNNSEKETEKLNTHDNTEFNSHQINNFSLNNINNQNNSTLIALPDQAQNNEIYTSSHSSEKFHNLNNKFSESNNKFFPNKSSKKTFSHIEDIIDKGDYNLKTFKIIFFASLFIFIEGFYLSYFSFILTAFQKFYELSDTAVQTVAAVKFLGMALGSVLVGFLSKRFSRKSIILFSVLSILILHFLMCFIKNVFVFAFIRFFITIFIGFYMVLIINMLTEYLPIRLRGFVLNVVWIFWNLGAIFFLVLCKIYIPSLDYDLQKPYLQQDFYAAIFPIFFVILATLIIYFFYLEDSPRNLIFNGQAAEAKKILEYYTKQQISDEDMKNIENNLVNKGENKFYENESGVKLIFHKRIRFLTLIMMALFFLISFGFYGISVATPVIIKRIQQDPVNSSTNINLISVSKNENGNYVNSNDFLKSISNNERRDHKKNIQNFINNQNDINNNDNNINNKNNNNAYSLIENKNSNSSSNNSDNTINSLILIFSIGLLGNFAGGIISEINSIGRKYSEIIMFILTLISGLISVFAYKDYSFWMGISNSLYGAAFNIHITYTEEIYPTKIRDFAFGILLGMTRIGGFASQFVFMAFSKASLFVAVYAYLVIVFVMILLLFFLPGDNVGHLDAKIDLDESKILNLSEDDITVLKEDANDSENQKFIGKEKKAAYSDF